MTSSNLMNAILIFYTPVENVPYYVMALSVRPAGWLAGRGHLQFFGLSFCHLCSYRIETWCIAFVIKSYCSSSRFGVIDSFLQELCP
jgi:hypothetical protein